MELQWLIHVQVCDSKVWKDLFLWPFASLSLCQHAGNFCLQPVPRKMSLVWCCTGVRARVAQRQLARRGGCRHGRDQLSNAKCREEEKEKEKRTREEERRRGGEEEERRRRRGVPSFYNAKMWLPRNQMLQKKQLPNLRVAKVVYFRTNV